MGNAVDIDRDRELPRPCYAGVGVPALGGLFRIFAVADASKLSVFSTTRTHFPL